MDVDSDVDSDVDIGGDVDSDVDMSQSNSRKRSASRSTSPELELPPLPVPPDFDPLPKGTHAYQALNMERQLALGAYHHYNFGLRALDPEDLVAQQLTATNVEFAPWVLNRYENIKRNEEFTNFLAERDWYPSHLPRDAHVRPADDDANLTPTVERMFESFVDAVDQATAWRAQNAESAPFPEGREGEYAFLFSQTGQEIVNGDAVTVSLPSQLKYYFPSWGLLISELVHVVPKPRDGVDVYEDPGVGFDFEIPSGDGVNFAAQIEAAKARVISRWESANDVTAFYSEWLTALQAFEATGEISHLSFRFLAEWAQQHGQYDDERGIRPLWREFYAVQVPEWSQHIATNGRFEFKTHLVMRGICGVAAFPPDGEGRRQAEHDLGSVYEMPSVAVTTAAFLIYLRDETRFLWWRRLTLWVKQPPKWLSPEVRVSDVSDVAKKEIPANYTAAAYQSFLPYWFMDSIRSVKFTSTQIENGEHLLYISDPEDDSEQIPLLRPPHEQWGSIPYRTEAYRFGTGLVNDGLRDQRDPSLKEFILPFRYQAQTFMLAARNEEVVAAQKAVDKSMETIQARMHSEYPRNRNAIGLRTTTPSYDAVYGLHNNETRANLYRALRNHPDNSPDIRAKHANTSWKPTWYLEDDIFVENGDYPAMINGVWNTVAVPQKGESRKAPVTDPNKPYPAKKILLRKLREFAEDQIKSMGERYPVEHPRKPVPDEVRKSTARQVEHNMSTQKTPWYEPITGYLVGDSWAYLDTVPDQAQMTLCSIKAIRQSVRVEQSIVDRISVLQNLCLQPGMALYPTTTYRPPPGIGIDPFRNHSRTLRDLISRSNSTNKSKNELLAAYKAFSKYVDDLMARHEYVRAYSHNLHPPTSDTDAADYLILTPEIIAAIRAIKTLIDGSADSRLLALDGIPELGSLVGTSSNAADAEQRRGWLDDQCDRIKADVDAWLVEKHKWFDDGRPTADQPGIRRSFQSNFGMELDTMGDRSRFNDAWFIQDGRTTDRGYVGPTGTEFTEDEPVLNALWEVETVPPPTWEEVTNQAHAYSDKWNSASPKAHNNWTRLLKEHLDRVPELQEAADELRSYNVEFSAFKATKTGEKPVKPSDAVHNVVGLIQTSVQQSSEDKAQKAYRAYKAWRVAQADPNGPTITNDEANKQFDAQWEAELYKPWIPFNPNAPVEDPARDLYPMRETLQALPPMHYNGDKGPAPMKLKPRDEILDELEAIEDAISAMTKSDRNDNKNALYLMERAEDLVEALFARGMITLVLAESVNKYKNVPDSANKRVSVRHVREFPPPGALNSERAGARTGGRLDQQRALRKGGRFVEIRDPDDWEPAILDAKEQRAKHDRGTEGEWLPKGFVDGVNKLAGVKAEHHPNFKPPRYERAKNSSINSDVVYLLEKLEFRILKSLQLVCQTIRFGGYRRKSGFRDKYLCPYRPLDGKTPNRPLNTDKNGEDGGEELEFYPGILDFNFPDARDYSEWLQSDTVAPPRWNLAKFGGETVLNRGDRGANGAAFEDIYGGERSMMKTLSKLLRDLTAVYSTRNSDASEETLDDFNKQASDNVTKLRLGEKNFNQIFQDKDFSGTLGKLFGGMEDVVSSGRTTNNIPHLSWVELSTPPDRGEVVASYNPDLWVATQARGGPQITNSGTQAALFEINFEAAKPKNPNAKPPKPPRPSTVIHRWKLRWAAQIKKSQLFFFTDGDGLNPQFLDQKNLLDARGKDADGNILRRERWGGSRQPTNALGGRDEDAMHAELTNAAMDLAAHTLRESIEALRGNDRLVITESDAWPTPTLSYGDASAAVDEESRGFETPFSVYAHSRHLATLNFLLGPRADMTRKDAAAMISSTLAKQMNIWKRQTDTVANAGGAQTANVKYARDYLRQFEDVAQYIKFSYDYAENLFMHKTGKLCKKVGEYVAKFRKYAAMVQVAETQWKSIVKQIAALGVTDSRVEERMKKMVLAMLRVAAPTSSDDIFNRPGVNMHTLIKLDENAVTGAANKIVNANKLATYKSLMRKAYIIRLHAGFSKPQYEGNEKDYPWKPRSWAAKRDFWQGKRDETLRKDLDKGLLRTPARRSADANRARTRHRPTPEEGTKAQVMLEEQRRQAMNRFINRRNRQAYPAPVAQMFVELARDIRLLLVGYVTPISIPGTGNEDVERLYNESDTDVPPDLDTALKKIYPGLKVAIQGGDVENANLFAALQQYAIEFFGILRELHNDFPDQKRGPIRNTSDRNPPISQVPDADFEGKGSQMALGNRTGLVNPDELAIKGLVVVPATLSTTPQPLVPWEVNLYEMYDNDATIHIFERLRLKTAQAKAQLQRQYQLDARRGVRGDDVERAVARDDPQKIVNRLGRLRNIVEDINSRPMVVWKRVCEFVMSMTQNIRLETLKPSVIMDYILEFKTTAAMPRNDFMTTQLFMEFEADILEVQMWEAKWEEARNDLDLLRAEDLYQRLWLLRNANEDATVAYMNTDSIMDSRPYPGIDAIPYEYNGVQDAIVFTGHDLREPVSDALVNKYKRLAGRVDGDEDAQNEATEDSMRRALFGALSLDPDLLDVPTAESVYDALMRLQTKGRDPFNERYRPYIRTVDVLQNNFYARFFEMICFAREEMQDDPGWKEEIETAYAERNFRNVATNQTDAGQPLNEDQRARGEAHKKRWDPHDRFALSYSALDLWDGRNVTAEGDRPGKTSVQLANEVARHYSLVRRRLAQGSNLTWPSQPDVGSIYDESYEGPVPEAVHPAMAALIDPRINQVLVNRLMGRPLHGNDRKAWLDDLRGRIVDAGALQGRNIQLSPSDSFVNPNDRFDGTEEVYLTDMATKNLVPLYPTPGNRFNNDDRLAWLDDLRQRISATSGDMTLNTLDSYNRNPDQYEIYLMGKAEGVVEPFPRFTQRPIGYGELRERTAARTWQLAERRYLTELAGTIQRMDPRNMFELDFRQRLSFAKEGDAAKGEAGGGYDPSKGPAPLELELLPSIGEDDDPPPRLADLNIFPAFPDDTGEDGDLDGDDDYVYDQDDSEDDDKDDDGGAEDDFDESGRKLQNEIALQQALNAGQGDPGAPGPDSDVVAPINPLMAAPQQPFSRQSSAGGFSASDDGYDDDFDYDDAGVGKPDLAPTIQSEIEKSNKLRLEQEQQRNERNPDSSPENQDTWSDEEFAADLRDIYEFWSEEKIAEEVAERRALLKSGGSWREEMIRRAAKKDPIWGQPPPPPPPPPQVQLPPAPPTSVKEVAEKCIEQLRQSLVKAIPFCRSLWERDRVAKQPKQIMGTGPHGDTVNVLDAFDASESVGNGDCFYHSIIISLYLFNKTTKYAAMGNYNACKTLRSELGTFIRKAYFDGPPIGPPPSAPTGRALDADSLDAWFDYYARKQADAYFRNRGYPFRSQFVHDRTKRLDQQEAQSDARASYDRLAPTLGWPSISAQSTDDEIVEAYIKQAEYNNPVQYDQTYASTIEMLMIPLFVRRPVCLYEGATVRKLVDVALRLESTFKMSNGGTSPTPARMHELLLRQLEAQLRALNAAGNDDPTPAELTRMVGYNQSLTLKTVTDMMEGEGGSAESKAKTSRRFRLGIRAGENSWKFEHGTLYGEAFSQLVDYDNDQLLRVGFEPVLLLHGGDGRRQVGGRRPMEHYQPIVGKHQLADAKTVFNGTRSDL